VRGRRRKSDDIWVLRDFSLTISPGEAVGVIGDNGAGKSTILKLGARIVEPTSGRVFLNGRVGALLEVGVGFHPDLSGLENIYLSGSVIGLGRREMASRINDIVEFSGVGEFITMPVRHYSSGMLIRLGFAVATSTDPDILLVDEVLSVGDISFRRKCLERIALLQQRGAAILYVSHNLEEVRSVCDHAVWLHDAMVRAEGHPDEVVEAYTSYHLMQRGFEVQQPSTAPGQGRRFGRGGLDITDCVVLDAQGCPVHSWTGEAPLTVRLDFECSRHLPQVAFGLSIYNEDGVRIATPNSPTYHDLCAGEAGSVFAVIPGMSLRPGPYDLTVAASDPLADEYTPFAHHHRAYRFWVPDDRNATEGVVSLPSRWVRTNSWDEARLATDGKRGCDESQDIEAIEGVLPGA